jgi:peptidoglycan hydrolase-like protein with peptidoglycan-binding domain
MVTANVCISQPVLQRGLSGTEVQSLQERLNLEFGARKQLITDGIFGARTEQAVKIIQYRYFLVQDGIVGRNTWAVLCNRKPLDMPRLLRGSTSPLVGQVQQVLSDAKLYQGAIDNSFGALTEKAVKQLQAAARLAQTGIIDQATWSALVEQAKILTA